MAVSKRTRYEVLKRDNFTCRYCRSSENPITIDHVVPVTLGGTDKPDNLVAACKDCNYGKASTNANDQMVVDVKADDLRWAKALSRVAAARARQTKKRNTYVNEFDNLWRQWKYGRNKDWDVPRADSWMYTIERFYDLGLPLEELLRCALIALRNDRIVVDETFRYFCGCAWRVVTEMQDAAREVLADGT